MEKEKKLRSPDAVIGRIRPGSRVFLSTGAAEPRTLVKYLMADHGANLQDLELIQIVSYADAISLANLQSQKFRLKTFYSGWIADDAITEGQVDLIPCPLARVPGLIESGKVAVDVAFVQITPPDKDGYCSLGIAVDVARLAIEKSSWSVGEINEHIPRTFGDTFIHISEFDMLVDAEEPPVYFPDWTVTPVSFAIAEHIAQLIDDGSCIAFSIGPLFVALSSKLTVKRNLGIHSPFFSDALMQLVKSGAVSNRNKELFRGKCLTSYACGTAELLAWLDENPTVEFQPVDKVFDPLYIGRNPNFVAVIAAKKVDITGRIELPIGRGNLSSGPAEVFAFIQGAQISEAGFTVFGLPSRDARSEANIVFSIGELKNRIDFREAVDFVVTEFGVANLKGLTLRERAQAMIEIAHPDDRAGLIAQAKQGKILYSDQIYLAVSADHGPPDICEKKILKDGLEICFRPIKPSDEEGMRRLFYRFSDESVYYRYFAPIRAMPHTRMQAYVNVNWSNTMSLVGVAGRPGNECILAEGRYLLDPTGQWAEVAFVVDEEYQNLGLSTHLFDLLIRHATQKGLLGFYADVLTSNFAMMAVLRKSRLPIMIEPEDGAYHVKMPLRLPVKAQGAPMG